MKDINVTVSEGDLVKTQRRVISTLESVPTAYYWVGGACSIVLSLGLYLTGRRSPAVMIGLWAPLLVLASYFIKHTRSEGEI